MRFTEVERQKTQFNRILKYLRDKGLEGATNRELSTFALRYGASIGEMYRLGYKITTEKYDGGLVRYTLLEEPKTHKEPPSALSKLVDELNENGIDADLVISLLNKADITVRFKANHHKKIH